MSVSGTRYARETANEQVMLAFKRHILESSAGFASEPMADLFRVNLLGMMLTRYDELRQKGLSEGGAAARTKQEFSDIAMQMRQQGFEEAQSEESASIWPQMTEAEVEAYFCEADDCTHKRSLGVALCTACVAPLMLFAAFAEFFAAAEDMLMLFGLMGMFAMIGMGVYALVTAGKPAQEKRIEEKRFSLNRQLRAKLEKMRSDVRLKARKRTGRGVAVIVMSLIPLFIGGAVTQILFSDGWAVFGVAGMFLMIAAGVYDLVMAGGEKKAVENLIGEEE